MGRGAKVTEPRHALTRVLGAEVPELRDRRLSPKFKARGVRGKFYRARDKPGLAGELADRASARASAARTPR